LQVIAAFFPESWLVGTDNFDRLAHPLEVQHEVSELTPILATCVKNARRREV
jgi:hypothetical protein